MSPLDKTSKHMICIIHLKWNENPAKQSDIQQKFSTDNIQTAFDRSLFLQKRVRGVKSEWCVVKPCTIDAFSAAITPVLRISSI